MDSLTDVRPPEGPTEATDSFDAVCSFGQSGQL